MFEPSQTVSNAREPSPTKARNNDDTFATPLALNVPDQSGTVFVVYRSAAGPGREWSLSGSVSYIGARSGATDTSGLLLPGYWKTKAAFELPLTPKLTFRAEADNLLDERYAQSSYNSNWIYPGAPRPLRASLRTDFFEGPRPNTDSKGQRPRSLCPGARLRTH